MSQKSILWCSKFLIGFSAFAISMVAIMAFTNPQSVMDLVNMNIPNTDAFSSIRGVYGGVSLTIVIFLVYLMRQQVTLALSFITLLWGSYAVSRIITIFAEGPLGAFGMQWLIIESVLFFCSGSLLLVLNRKTAHV